MTLRRDFLAFVGGATLVGAVRRAASATTPTLILPSTMVLPTPPAIEGYPLLSQYRNHFDALFYINKTVPEELYLDWLEGGLRLARGCEPGGPVWRARQAEGHS